MITIAVLMYHSGRVAAVSFAAERGRKLPTTSPAMSARMYPASPVRFSDHETPNLSSLSGVAAMFAWCPRNQQTQLIQKTTVNAAANSFGREPRKRATSVRTASRKP